MSGGCGGKGEVWACYGLGCAFGMNAEAKQRAMLRK